MSNLFSTPAAFAAGSPSVRSGGRNGSHAPCMAWVLAMMMALAVMFAASNGYAQTAAPPPANGAEFCAAFRQALADTEAYLGNAAPVFANAETRDIQNLDVGGYPAVMGAEVARWQSWLDACSATTAASPRLRFGGGMGLMLFGGEAKSPTIFGAVLYEPHWNLVFRANMGVAVVAAIHPRAEEGTGGQGDTSPYFLATANPRTKRWFGHHWLGLNLGGGTVGLGGLTHVGLLWNPPWLGRLADVEVAWQHLFDVQGDPGTRFGQPLPNGFDRDVWGFALTLHN